MSKRVVIGAVLLATLAGGCAVRDRLFRDRSELVSERQPCVRTVIPIYFERDEARLSAPARALIRETTADLAGCHVPAVRVIGLADATGTRDVNLRLSDARARAVAEAFGAEGWPAPLFETVAAGDAGAVRADGAAEPVRRRVEIVIEAAPPAR